MSDLTTALSLHEVEPDWLAQVRIRRLTGEDLPALEWEGEYRRFRKVYREVYRRVENGLAVMWGAEYAEELLIGQVFVQLKMKGRMELADGARCAYVHSFRVRPEYRRAGLGTRLMEAAEGDLVRRGFQAVTLNVSRQNPAARRLYERLGYEVIGVDPGRWSYYDERGMLRSIEDPGWRMRKELNGRD